MDYHILFKIFELGSSLKQLNLFGPPDIPLFATIQLSKLSIWESTTILGEKNLRVKSL